MIQERFPIVLKYISNKCNRINFKIHIKYNKGVSLDNRKRKNTFYDSKIQSK